MANPPPKFRWAIFIGIALLALAIRLPQLGGRPMHTDESINAYITGDLLAGEPFHYDPRDRHGPLLYALAEPLARLQGAKNFAELTEPELRLTPVLAGTATILLLGAGVEMFGFIACLTAAILFAFGPLPVYYSRYFIHETLFVAATLGLLLSGWRWLSTNSASAAALAGLCAALMLACKETAVIHFFAIAAACLLGWRLLPRRSADCQSAVSPVGNRRATTATEPEQSQRPKRPQLRTCLIALAVFLATTVLLFTWFGRNWSGLTDLFHAFPNNAARAAGQGHEKPFGYYFALLDASYLMLPLTLAGIYIAIWEAVNGNRQPHLLLVLYAAFTFLIYSVIPYKTPWLALNLWLPLTIINGFGVTAIWSIFTKPAMQWIAGVVCLLFVLSMLQETKILVFDKPADEKNPYAYAHTGEDILRLPPRLAELAKERSLANPRIAVVAADAWPLPWYLRHFSQVGYWQPDQDPGPADFYITSVDVSDSLAAKLKGMRPDYFGVRPEVLAILWTPQPTNAPAATP